MKKALFDALCAAITGPTANDQGSIGREVIEAMLLGATERQAGLLVALFPCYYRQKRNGEVVCKPAEPVKAPEPPTEETDPNAQVVNTVNAVLGQYGHEHAATVEARQYEHPNVFQYRSGIFPDPRNFNVEVKVTSAQPVELDDPNLLYPWGVAVTMDVIGRSQDTDAWVERFKAQARLQLSG
jgi:hypothetical protein